MPPNTRHSRTLTLCHPHHPPSNVRIYYESTRMKQNSERKVSTVAQHIRTAAQSAYSMQYVKQQASNHLNISGDDGVDSNEPKYNKTSHQCMSN